MTRRFDGSIEVPVVTVYCDAAEHSDPIGPQWPGRQWESGCGLPDDVVIVAEFGRHPDIGWTVEPFSARWGGRVRQPHKNTVQYLAADGSKVPLSGMDMSRQAADLERARNLAGTAELWSLGRRYNMLCPVCRHHEVRRSGDKMHSQLDSVVIQGFTGISLAFLNETPGRAV
jgi:hypothetical protein